MERTRGRVIDFPLVGEATDWAQHKSSGPLVLAPRKSRSQSHPITPEAGPELLHYEERTERERLQAGILHQLPSLTLGELRAIRRLLMMRGETA